ncbi:glycoside hydrolase family 19 protein [Pseudomonas aeruginosa]|uniref:glycoside hydrolase family 19 protein n=1 Tax=Pseudomonas aeruginosa TaxID=287 RepID=UPI000710C133|nr:glycoside hydrolase family 19 protein [Pseudomonas aeruginosa]NNB83791.1 glycoside hydrolase family 19 protein [Pseudomonas aeruginosa]RUB28233.1 glycoside hydrolase family 19 protein [Pseudomonas aeruginosa]HCD6632391.1 glycoside hydrolase family 19 protein [Pseudomonas aeruginosa]HCD7566900.1 glycoside hydrolase family 19 protein [Pseudomonas aeruginosa]HCZ9127262.1 glycoside hydrolase family 19 protein [Pseudomonas aeruginosa]
MSDTPKPTSRMGYPFNAKDGKPFADAQPAYEGLAFADGGHFPLGDNGHFHGGIHFDRATANAFSIDEGVHCLADGEIVAYRLDRSYPDATPAADTGEDQPGTEKAALRPYSTGFVLIRHHLQAPALPAPASDDEVAQTITELDYGARLATRENGPTIGWLPVYARVALLDMRDGWVKVRILPPSTATWTNEPEAEPWLQARSLDKVPPRLPNRWFGGEPPTAMVVLGSQPRPVAQPDAAQPQTPSMPTPSLVLYSLYMHLADGATYDAKPNLPRPGWWSKKQYRAGSKTRNRWTLQGTLIEGLMVRSTPVSRPDNELGILVRGSRVEVEPIAGNDKWVMLRNIVEGGVATKPDGARVTSLMENGYVFLKELDELLVPEAFDSIQLPSPPIPIDMGTVIGHMGEQVSSCETLFLGQAASRPTLHLEAFSADDVPQFLRDSRRHADKLPERHWTLLGLRKGDALKSEPRDDAATIIELETDWTETITRDTTQQQDDQGQTWISVTVHRAAGSTVQGWAKDQDRRLTPWHWPGFEVVDAASNDAGTWWEGTAQIFVDFLRGGPRPPETPFFQQIRQLVDSNRDGRLTEEELDAALKDRAVAKRIGGLIAFHTSEWHVPSWASKYGVISDIALKFGQRAKDNVEAEKNCVLRLRWWSEVASSVGLPGDAKVYHFHPIGLAGNFNLIPPQLITLEMLNLANPSGLQSYHESILPILNAYAPIYGIDTPIRIAHFLAQTGHESGFKIRQENGNYSAVRMRMIFGCRGGQKNYITATDSCELGKLRIKLWSQENTYANNPVNLLSYVYSDRMGNGNEASQEGYKYRGRGLIQLTGKDTYRRYMNHHNSAIPEDIQDFLSNPDLISTEIRYGIESAFWYCMANNFSAAADKDDLTKTTFIINGGTNGLEDRRTRLNSLKRAMGI